MTATLPEKPDVDVATEQDLEVAFHRALERAGLTYQELADQATYGRFSSVRARLAWVAIGDLARLADGKRDDVRPEEAG